MKLLLLLTLLTSTAIGGFGQTLFIADSSGGWSNLTQTPNSLNSIRDSFQRRSDSLRSVYTMRVWKLDSLTLHFENRLDSLKKNQLPPTIISQTIDSLRLLRAKTLDGLEKKLQDVKEETLSKIKELKLPPEMNEQFASLTQSVEGFKPPDGNLTMPNINAAVNSIGNLSDVNSKLFNINENPLTKANFSNIESPTQLKNLASQGSELKDLNGQFGGIGKEAQQISNGNFTEIAESAEIKLADASGLGELKNPAEILNEYSELSAMTMEPETLTQELLQKVQQTAINHFAGKEQQIQQAMEMMSKYKTQYASVPDISKLPKRRPNEMKGKPLIERMVPGIAMQIQKEGEKILVDFNPYLGYRLTGRVTAGIGWNQRIGYETKQNDFSSKLTIYGLRVYGEYNLWKGFCPRVELEVMNAFVTPPMASSSLDVGQREWVWGAFVGIKKDYTFIHKVRGTAMIMTRLFDPQHKSPYADVINARFGFEFPIRKKAKKTKEDQP